MTPLYRDQFNHQGASFSRPRVSNDNPCSESLFRIVNYRPDHLSGDCAAWKSAAAMLLMSV
jgi:hypothetical protein